MPRPNVANIICNMSVLRDRLEKALDFMAQMNVLKAQVNGLKILVNEANNNILEPMNEPIAQRKQHHTCKSLPDSLL